MPQKKPQVRRKRRKKKSKLQQRLNKWTPYFIVGLFAYTLHTTQFFHFFSQSQREARETHLTQENEISLIFNFSRPQDVMDLMMNLQKYFAQIMTNIDLNQMYSFLHDGFAFGGNVREQDRTREHPSEYQFVRGVRRDQLRYDEDQLTQNPHDMPVSDEPTVFLFNSHPTEWVGTTNALAHVSGEMNVVEMSNLMAEHFENYGIRTLVESRCVTDILAERGWRFPQSYDASRVFLEEAINQYDSLQFFFDLHRDTIPRNRATVEYNGESFARVLMVIGTDNPRGYQENWAVAEKILEMLDEKVPGISLGIRPTGGIGVNGVYNQDLASTVQLFEIGGYESTAEEATNTIRVLSSVLAEFIQNHQE